MVAIPLLTEVVVLLEVSSEKVDIGIEVLSAVTLTEMAPEMTLSQVQVEGVLIEETLVAELAPRVTFIRRVLGVAGPPVSGQSLARVQLKFPRKQLQVFHADVTEVKLVSLVDVLLELAEVPEGRDMVTQLAVVLRHCIELRIQRLVGEVQVVLFIEMPPSFHRE